MVHYIFQVIQNTTIVNIYIKKLMYYTIYMVDYTIDGTRILQRKYINTSIYVTTFDQGHPCFDTYVYAEYIIQLAQNEFSSNFKIC